MDYTDLGKQKIFEDLVVANQQIFELYKADGFISRVRDASREVAKHPVMKYVAPEWNLRVRGAEQKEAYQGQKAAHQSALQQWQNDLREHNFNIQRAMEEHRKNPTAETAATLNSVRMAKLAHTQNKPVKPTAPQNVQPDTGQQLVMGGKKLAGKALNTAAKVGKVATAGMLGAYGAGKMAGSLSGRQLGKIGG